MKMLVYDSFSIFILHAFLYILFRPKTIDKFYCVFFAEQVLTFLIWVWTIVFLFYVGNIFLYFVYAVHEYVTSNNHKQMHINIAVLYMCRGTFRQSSLIRYFLSSFKLF